MDTLLKLEHETFDLSPEKKFVTAYRSIVPEASWPPPWQKCMPASVFETFQRTLAARAKVAMERCDREYYETTYVSQTPVFDSLQRARIDVANWQRAALENPHDGALRSFQPGSDGFASAVAYDRFGTKTGRLTCAGGPSMLTLRKDLRARILLPSSPDEELWMLDFSALEPRILLYEAGLRCDELDLYDDIRRKYLPEITRDVVKGSIIAAAYGMSKHAWGKRVGVSGDELDRIDDVVRSKFGAHDLLVRLRRQVIETGFIRNRFGRKIVLDELQDNRLLNAYAQSTGADVALLGFGKLLTSAVNRGKLPIKPLFLLHDAMIVSAAKGALDENQILRVKCSGYVQSFLLKCVYLAA